MSKTYRVWRVNVFTAKGILQWYVAAHKPQDVYHLANIRVRKMRIAETESMEVRPIGMRVNME